MIVGLDNTDLAFIASLITQMASMPTSMSFGTNTLDVKIKAKGIPISINIGFRLIGTDIEADITKATALGLGAFGQVRKMANDTLVSSLAPFSKYLSVTRNQRGNLTISMSGVTFTECSANLQRFELSLV